MKKQWLDDSSMVLLQHPIYRIFYVSHDSQDLKIFSYIARDSTNIFRCSVFKSNKKSQAMRVVRTVGQAFEVCHKLSINSPTQEEQQPSDKDSISEKNKKDNYCDELSIDDLVAAVDSNSTIDVRSTSSPVVGQRPLRLDIIGPPPQQNNHQRKSPISAGETYSSPLSEPLKPVNEGCNLPSAGTPLGAHHELQLLREQLEQQTQQTQAAVAQVHLLRDQLAAETNARLEAQARIHQLLVHNKELLDHISALVQHLQEQERLQGNQVTSVPQMSPTTKVTRWFEMFDPAPTILPLSRPESGFVDSPEGDDNPDSTFLINRLSIRKRRKLLGLKIGKVTTF